MNRKPLLTFIGGTLVGGASGVALTMLACDNKIDALIVVASGVTGVVGIIIVAMTIDNRRN